MNTPWGPSQNWEKIAPGIFSHSTASHGGFHLSAERLAAMPEHLKVPGWGGNAARGWFEEDCDAALVMLAFPEHFPHAQGESGAAMRSVAEHSCGVTFPK